MKGFRPLSLCNVVFKLVSRVIVSRPKETWRSIISPLQASFVSGRHSIDNFIVCQEFVHTTRTTKARKGSAIIKLDLDKAYDRLEWAFIEDSMRDAALPEGHIAVVMKMVTTGSCRLIWNGEVTDAIKPT